MICGVSSGRSSRDRPVVVTGDSVCLITVDGQYVVRVGHRQDIGGIQGQGCADARQLNRSGRRGERLVKRNPLTNRNAGAIAGNGANRIGAVIGGRAGDRELVVHIKSVKAVRRWAVVHARDGNRVVGRVEDQLMTGAGLEVSRGYGGTVGVRFVRRNLLGAIGRLDHDLGTIVDPT